MRIEKYIYPDPAATSIAAITTGIYRDPLSQKDIPKMVEPEAYKVSLGERTELAGKVYDKNGNIKNIYMCGN